MPLLAGPLTSLPASQSLSSPVLSLSYYLPRLFSPLFCRLSLPFAFLFSVHHASLSLLIHFVSSVSYLLFTVPPVHSLLFPVCPGPFLAHSLFPSISSLFPLLFLSFPHSSLSLQIHFLFSSLSILSYPLSFSVSYPLVLLFRILPCPSLPFSMYRCPSLPLHSLPSPFVFPFHL